MKASYPRVLFITPCAFNKITGGGITFTNLFKGWPVDRLLTVTGDHIPFSHDVCDNYFRLSKDELRYVHPFSVLASPIIENRFVSLRRTEATAGTRQLFYRLAKKILGNAGLPDCGTVSSSLRKQVGEFKPEVLYTILGSTGYLDIVLGLQREFQIPTVVHVMDEGVVNPEYQGLFGFFKKRAFRKRLNQILRKTAIAVAICPLMASAYTNRYGIEFEHFQNTIDIDRYRKFHKKDISTAPVPRVVYAGSILPYAQAESIIDCCKAVSQLNDSGFKIEFDIYTPLDLLSVEKSSFLISDHISLYDIPDGDEAFFAILNSADVLLLPVNFDKESTHFIRYSMPTKIPGYLLSCTPILVYGPEEVAQVAYARELGWGLVTNRQNIETLAANLRRIITNRDLRRTLNDRASKALETNHDAKNVRQAFQALIMSAARGN